jgi:hypothetical protein
LIDGASKTKVVPVLGKAVEGRVAEARWPAVDRRYEDLGVRGLLAAQDVQAKGDGTEISLDVCQVARRFDYDVFPLAFPVL